MFKQICKLVYRAKQIPFGIAIKKFLSKFFNKKTYMFPNDEILTNIQEKNVFSYVSFSSKFNFEKYKEKIISINSKIKNGNIPIYNQFHSLSIAPEQYNINWAMDLINLFPDISNIKSNNIPLPYNSNIDIRQIWELGRCHHLLSIASESYFETISEESFKLYNNILEDFQNSNDFGYGPQWMCAMDVGIRAVNILISNDLLNSNTKINKLKIETIALEHLKFVIENLEWSEGMRGNHYFANIVCIIIISAYLPNEPNISQTLAFGIQELINEIEEQFNDDGSNFEASISYHCFMVEMFLLATAFINSLPNSKINDLKNITPIEYSKRKKLFPLNKQKFVIENEQIFLPKSYYKKLTKIISFTNSILIDSSFPNFGDDDSASILRFHFLEKNFLLKELLNLFSNDECFLNFNKINFQNILLEVGNREAGTGKRGLGSGKDSFDRVYKELFILNNQKMQIDNFKDFGLFKVNNPNYTFFFRYGSVGQNGKGGHSHNDLLSFVLYINNIEFFTDPGTYCYTSNAKERNKYRSANSHNTLIIHGKEPIGWFGGNADDLFWSKIDKANCKLVEYNKLSLKKIKPIPNKSFTIENANYFISGVHNGYGKKYTRNIYFGENKITGIETFHGNEKKYLRFHLHPEIKIVDFEDSRIVLERNNLKVEFTTMFGNCVLLDYDYADYYMSKKKSKAIQIDFKYENLVWVLGIRY